MAKTAIAGILIGLAAMALLAPLPAAAQPPAFAPTVEAAHPKLVSDRDVRRHWDRDRRHDRDWHKKRIRDRADRRDARRRHWSGNTRYDERKDWGHRAGDSADWGIRRSDRHRDLYRNRDRRADTYSGGGGVWRDPGNGTYVYGGDSRVGGSGLRIIEVPTRRGPKVLGIAPESFEGACDRSGRVCIIRPGR
ncbi:hypothetical protein [Hoeflea sp.]|uniref:hypothetical protein n=1 Tax=Hoeflea sp. TaxID=1940281 RepID=UPI0019B81CA0|nr:hypothetical protein [Hoeflea sp.]MBC7284319.1 hypothetical protein [Hoeflea sp.]